MEKKLRCRLPTSFLKQEDPIEIFSTLKSFKIWILILPVQINLLPLTCSVSFIFQLKQMFFTYCIIEVCNFKLICFVFFLQYKTPQLIPLENLLAFKQSQQKLTHLFEQGDSEHHQLLKVKIEPSKVRQGKDSKKRQVLSEILFENIIYLQVDQL